MNMRNIQKTRVYKFIGTLIYGGILVSSYDERNMAQIATDELIVKFKRRLKEIEFNAIRYTEDRELLRQLNLLVSDLMTLKITIDKASKKGDLHGKKN